MRDKKWCFSKKLLLVDYVILLAMVAVFFIFTVTGKDTSNCAVVVAAWVAQIAVSSGAYYWKAKSENLLKLAIQMLKDLPEDMKERADPNQIIASVLGLKD
ncbi:TPA: hypothetical protein KZI03_000586 [Listeria monocytogenes]|nr:hypothetical protein [Listeria monocytogenes]HBI2193226.1 hypothetical protein [Listeria monocytogenes]